MLLGILVDKSIPKINREGQMRITLESDYALRIVSELALHENKVDAKKISELTSVSENFTLKILRKLVMGGYVKSYKGANGGYALNVAPQNITLKEIIELIDGPILISKCLDNGEGCSLNKDKTSCVYHHIFDAISYEVASKFSKITISDVLNKKVTF